MPNKTFKTYDGALRRARFEEAHQSHLSKRYRYLVEKQSDGTWKVVRYKKDDIDRIFNEGS